MIIVIKEVKTDETAVSCEDESGFVSRHHRCEHGTGGKRWQYLLVLRRLGLA